MGKITLLNASKDEQKVLIASNVHGATGSPSKDLSVRFKSYYYEDYLSESNLSLTLSLFPTVTFCLCLSYFPSLA